jgi:hypothetical protein
MAATPLDRETILKTIATWPVEEQVTLARTILERVAAQSGAPAQGADAQPPERSTWEALYGIASSEQQPPSDEQVAQWLDEHRTEKYGG